MLSSALFAGLSGVALFSLVGWFGFDTLKRTKARKEARELRSVERESATETETGTAKRTATDTAADTEPQTKARSGKSSRDSVRRRLLAHSVQNTRASGQSMTTAAEAAAEMAALESVLTEVHLAGSHPGVKIVSLGASTDGVEAFAVVRGSQNFGFADEVVPSDVEFTEGVKAHYEFGNKP